MYGGRVGNWNQLSQVWRCGSDALPLLLGVKLGAVAESTEPCRNSQTPTSSRDNHRSTL